jgi:hypothetical protein
MIDYKRYTIWLVSLIAIETLVLLLTCLYLQPVAGDTTRLSGYSENDFGWNIPQKTFSQDANLLQEAYDHYVDVLVLGDSFSFGGVLGMMNYPWQTFLTAETGWSVSSISHYTTKTNPPSYDPTLIPAIVNSEMFQKKPPKILVLEVVERQLHMLPKISGDCKLHNKIKNYQQLSIKPIPGIVPTNEVYRTKIQPSLNKRLDFAVKYWENLLSFNTRENQSFLFDLTSPKLFSSKESDTLLVYEGDVKKKNWDDLLVDNIKCRLVNIQNLVQANGKTLFVVMVAPDKLTAYSPFLKDSSIAKYSVIDRLASVQSLHLPRFDLPLQSAIREGLVDVYLPNDTHWANQGQKIAAETLIKYLIQFSGE